MDSNIHSFLCMHSSTKAIHLGNFEEANGAIAMPIVLSTTFERGEDQLSFPSGYLYSRNDNPNRNALEQKISMLEEGAESIAFSSGMSATLAVFQSLGAGSHIILPDDMYYAGKNILQRLYAQWNISFSEVDMSNLEAVKNAILPNTKLIWIETPSNPMLKITDIEGIAKIAKARNILTVCDNTWATPYFQKPLVMGIDISMNATTKYLAGHSDILGGALTFKEKNNTSEFIKDFQRLGGAVPSPFDCWLLCRSISTFHARMPIHANNAMILAEYLTKHPKIEKVIYPGLSNNKYHEIAKNQMIGGFGGMMSVLVKGGQKEALNLVSKMKIFKHATSLGGVESLIEHRKSVEGIHSNSPENLLRISVGIEDVRDLIEDFGD